MQYSVLGSHASLPTGWDTTRSIPTTPAHLWGTRGWNGILESLLGYVCNHTTGAENLEGHTTFTQQICQWHENTLHLLLMPQDTYFQKRRLEI